jgi:hypothetical protein
MKLQLFLFLMLVSVSVSYSQKKKHVYYDEKHQVISKRKFEKLDDYHVNLALHYENETQFSSILVTRQNYGQLSREQYSTLKKSLSPNKALTSEFIVIEYYPGLDECNLKIPVANFGKIDRNARRKLDKIGTNDVFFIYKKDDRLTDEYEKLDSMWQLDKNEVVESLFFELHYPCSSVVAINNKGQYISFFGEHGDEDGVDFCAELKQRESQETQK